jgi:hypothetical protein
MVLDKTRQSTRLTIHLQTATTLLTSLSLLLLLLPRVRTAAELLPASLFDSRSLVAAESHAT